MKIKAYIHFPETDIAFQNLNDNPEAYTEIVKELLIIKHKLKRNQDYELYYDSDNLSSFLAVAEIFISGPHLAGIGNQLKTLFGNKTTNVNSPKLRDHQFIYATWATSSVSTSLSPFLIAESAENLLKDTETDKTICICLGNSLKIDKERLFVIKDAIHLDPFPVLITIPAANNGIGFIRWVTTLPQGKFALKGNSEYESLEKFWNKERIYKHKATGHYWYFDFFHRENKIHYEVFDDSGSHLGEADENGHLKVGTMDANKKITDII